MKNKRKNKKKHLPNHKGIKRCKYQYYCVDGNWTYYPVAFCVYYDGVLTKGLMNTHKCKERKCKRLQEGIDFE